MGHIGTSAWRDAPAPPIATARGEGPRLAPKPWLVTPDLSLVAGVGGGLSVFLRTEGKCVTDRGRLNAGLFEPDFPDLLEREGEIEDLFTGGIVLVGDAEEAGLRRLIGGHEKARARHLPGARS